MNLQMAKLLTLKLYTVNPLYNDIRYNSKIVITLICSAQKSANRVFYH